MKAIFEHVATDARSSISVHRYSLPAFVGPYHFHPELELTYIERSEGKRYLGRDVSLYKEGDLVLLGGNTPHCWRSHKTDGPDDAAQAIVIQFKKELLGESQAFLPEWEDIHAFLGHLKGGRLIEGETKTVVVRKMKEMLTAPHLLRSTGLLEILHTISTSDETKPIDDDIALYATTPSETRRFQAVFAHVIEHYHESISLEEMAAIAHLTPTAFCRYFKQITGKTLTQVVTAHRLHHAGSLLVSTQKSISEIGLESGFATVTHFNKIFKKEMGCSPSTYRELNVKN